MEKAKKIDEKKYEHYLKANLHVTTHKKTRLVPEWVTNTTVEDNTWFTLDGKEIKGEKKSTHRIWEGNDEDPKMKEEQKVEQKDTEPEKENSDENVWNAFQIKPEQKPVDDFPALGGGRQFQKPEKVPVIVSKKTKAPTKMKQSAKKTIRYKNDDGVEKELNLSDSESQYLVSGDSGKFTLQQFILAPAKDNRNKRKKKGKR